MHRIHQRRAEPSKSTSVRFANNPSQTSTPKPAPKTSARPTSVASRGSSQVSSAVSSGVSSPISSAVPSSVSSAVSSPITSPVSSAIPSSLQPSGGSSALSGGAIAGIVIGVLVFLASVGALVALRWRRRAQAPVRAQQFNPPMTHAVYQPQLQPQHLPEGLGIYQVAATYTPTLSDEIDIQVGDQVQLLVEYDDGWCQGMNLTQNTKGVFPKHCLQFHEETAMKRLSSMRS